MQKSSALNKFNGDWTTYYNYHIVSNNYSEQVISLNTVLNKIVEKESD